MKTIIIVALLVLMAGPVLAEQRYNALEDRWDTVPANADYQYQYNPMTDRWSYQPQGAQIEYNAFQDSWDWNTGIDNR